MSLFNLCEHDAGCKQSVGSPRQIRTCDKGGAAISDTVRLSDERARLAFADEVMEEKGGASEIDARDEEYTKELREKTKEMIYDMCGLSDTFGRHRGNSMAELFLLICSTKTSGWKCSER